MTISRVLITGGTGFVGRWMQATKPDDIMCRFVGRDGYGNMPWDLIKADAIIHLAPVSPARVLEYAKKHKARVLFASSGAVYGKLANHHLYTAEKCVWELLCEQSGADVIIARLFTFVGAHLKNLYAITNFIENARRGEPLRVQSNGEAVRSYLYGEDLGRWMWKLLLEGEDIYDVGGSVPYTILEVARLVADIMKTQIEVWPHGPPPTVYLPNTTRAHELGCEETIGLHDAIERTINENERLVL